MWLIKCNLESKKGRGANSAIISPSKIRKANVNELKEGQYYYQCYNGKAVRRLIFEPSSFRDSDKYKKQLQTIGVYVEISNKKKKVQQIKPLTLW